MVAATETRKSQCKKTGSLGKYTPSQKLIGFLSQIEVNSMLPNR
jgi:hypothetical protein